MTKISTLPRRIVNSRPQIPIHCNNKQLSQIPCIDYRYDQKGEMCLGNNKPNSMAMARSSKLSNIRSILLAANCQNSTVKQKLRNLSDCPLYPKKNEESVQNVCSAYNYRTFTFSTFTLYLDHGLYTSAECTKPQLLSTRWVCPLYEMMNDPLPFLTPNFLTLSNFFLVLRFVSESMSPSFSPSSMKTIVWTLCFKDGQAT